MLVFWVTAHKLPLPAGHAGSGFGEWSACALASSLADVHWYITKGHYARGEGNSLEFCAWVRVGPCALREACPFAAMPSKEAERRVCLIPCKMFRRRSKACRLRKDFTKVSHRAQ